MVGYICVQSFIIVSFLVYIILGQFSNKLIPLWAQGHGLLCIFVKSFIIVSGFLDTLVETEQQRQQEEEF